VVVVCVVWVVVVWLVAGVAAAAGAGVVVTGAGAATVAVGWASVVTVTAEELGALESAANDAELISTVAIKTIIEL
jgi:hypothetical protein